MLLLSYLRRALKLASPSCALLVCELKKRLEAASSLASEK